MGPGEGLQMALKWQWTGGRHRATKREGWGGGNSMLAGRAPAADVMLLSECIKFYF